MRSTKSRSIAAALAATLLAPLFVALTPGTATALPPGAGNGCKNSVNQSAEMGMFPANPASQSSLKISCLFDSDVDSATYMATSAFTLHDFENVLYHNGAARVVTNSAAVAVGASAIQIGAANGATLSTWVNRAITGPGIAARTFVTSITAGGQVNLSELTTAATAINAGTFKIDNATGARSIDTATLTGGANTITTVAGVGTSANFLASDVGLSVSGTRVPAACTIASVVNANSATMSCVANGAGAFPGQIITIGGTLVVNSARSVDDATRDAALQRVVSIVGRNTADDIGLAITGTGIAAGAVITGVSGAGLKNMAIGGSCAPTCVLTTSAIAQTIVIGAATGTATAQGDTVLSMGIQLDLSPSLVPGSQTCTAEEPEGFMLAGTIFQPGNFQSPLFGSTPPVGKRVLAQILMDTATTSDFAGYIVQQPIAAAGDPDASSHYDVVFPSLPLTLALCEGVPTTSYDSPGVGLSVTVLGQTASQASALSGVGRPGTSQLRAVQASVGGYLSTVFIDSQSGPVLSPAGDFNRLCVYPAVGEVKFTCGNG